LPENEQLNNISIAKLIVFDKLLMSHLDKKTKLFPDFDDKLLGPNPLK